MEPTLTHQYSSNATHRIVELDRAGFLLASGEWVSYHNLAVYTTNEGFTYICGTDYYNGVLTPDTIYKITKTDYKSEKPYATI